MLNKKNLYMQSLLFIAIMILMMFSFEVGFLCGNIQGSMDTMSYCMLQNMTIK